MDHDPAVGDAAQTLGQLGLRLIELAKIGGLIVPEVRRVIRVHPDEGFRDVPHHDFGVLWIQPNMRVAGMMRVL